ncbi:hypothetical protein CL614_04735, partial [archaeon]|nr:hypothetical protein [archaeon]
QNFSGSIDNLTIRPTMDEDGRADIFTNKYLVEKFPLSHYNGPFYLTFLAKWQELPTWENYNTSGSGFLIPSGAFNNQYILPETTPTVTEESTGSWTRFVLAASQSYWAPVDGFSYVEFTDTDANDGDQWNIYSGSAPSGSYGIPAGFEVDESLMVYNSSSILPTGELFRLYHVTSSDTSPPITSSYLTDIKLFKNDIVYSGSYSTAVGSISDVLPFSHLYTTSSQIVQDWFSSSLGVAVRYDKENINSLYNNLPQHVKDDDDNLVLNKFVGMTGEYYDYLKNYIDNYTNILRRGYDTYDGVPQELIKSIGENFGWKFVNSNSIKNLLHYYIGDETEAFSYNDLTKNIWNNLLNNLNYIYKTKGTEASVRAFLNSFGLPPDIISVDEVGGSSEQQQQTSPGVLNLATTKGLRRESGNVSFNEYKSRLSSLHIDSRNGPFTTEWNTTSTGITTAVRFAFTMALSSSLTSSEAAVILKSSGSGADDFWDVIYISSSTAPDSGSVQLRLNHNSNPTGSYGFSTTSSISSSDLPIASLDNRKVWNVLVQRTTTTGSLSDDHTYELHISNKEDDTIDLIESMSFTTSSVNQNTHFMSESALNFGEAGFTGSISEISVYSGSDAYTTQNFQMFAMDHNSMVGPNIDSFKDITYQYKFRGLKGRVNDSTVIKDVTNNNTKGNFTKALGSDFSDGTVITEQVVNVFQFSPRNLNPLDEINTNKIIIAGTPAVKKNGLSPFMSNLVYDSRFNIYGNQVRKSVPKINISVAPTNIINRIINYSVLDKDLGTLWGKPSDRHEEKYSNLISIREQILDQYGSILNINDFMRTLSDAIPMGMWSGLKKLLPESVQVSGDFVLKSDILYRNKTSLGLSEKYVSSLHSTQKSSLNPDLITFTSDMIKFDVSKSFVPVIMSGSMDFSSDGNIGADPDVNVVTHYSSSLDYFDDSNISDTLNHPLFEAIINGGSDWKFDGIENNASIQNIFSSKLFDPDVNVKLSNTKTQALLSAELDNKIKFKEDSENFTLNSLLYTDPILFYDKVFDEKGQNLFVPNDVEVYNVNNIMEGDNSQFNIPYINDSELLNTEKLLNMKNNSLIPSLFDTIITGKSPSQLLSENNTTVESSIESIDILKSLERISMLNKLDYTINVNKENEINLMSNKHLSLVTDDIIGSPSDNFIEISEKIEFIMSDNFNNFEEKFDILFNQYYISNDIGPSDNVGLESKKEIIPTGGEIGSSPVIDPNSVVLLPKEGEPLHRKTSDMTTNKHSLIESSPDDLIVDKNLDFSLQTAPPGEIGSSPVILPKSSFLGVNESSINRLIEQTLKENSTYPISSTSDNISISQDSSITVNLNNTSLNLPIGEIPDKKYFNYASKSDGYDEVGVPSIDDSVGTNFTNDLRNLYGDKNNPNYTFFNAETNNDSGSAAHATPSVSFPIGDYEVAWTQKTKTTIKEKHSFGWIGPIYDFLFVPYNPGNVLHYKDGVIDNDGKFIGRTNRITIHEDGNHSYPGNHYINFIDNAWIDHINEGTINTGEETKHLDPLYQFDENTRNGAVFTRIVDDGDSKLVVQ